MPIHWRLKRASDHAGALKDPREVYQARSGVARRTVILPPLVSVLAGFLLKMPIGKALLFGILLGVPLATITAFLKWSRSAFKLRSFLLNIVFHSVLLVSTISVGTLCEVWAIDLLGNQRDLLGVSAPAWIIANYVIVLEVYGLTLLLSLIVSSVRAISKKMGPGVMSAWALGYYHEPRKETRVVMFVDLRDSTSLAEQLGDERFSALVRDFFAAMTRPLEISQARVSHYIGDEAVVTWSASGAPLAASCVQFFYLLEEAIRLKADSFLANYGVLPSFKAGVHFGPMMVTEVGESKSEFVLHGDVLNTAARIQGLCSDYGEKLILSKDLASQLRPEAWFYLTEIGEAALKGKSRPVSLVAAKLKGCCSSPS